MDSTIYYAWIVGIASIYFIFLMLQSRYRLILPSVVNTAVWLVTALLVLCQLKGWLVTETISDSDVNLVSRFTFLLVIASVIGFSLAHIVTAIRKPMVKRCEIDTNLIEIYLVRFRWVPYMSGIVGIILFIFLITTIGDISTFGDYRVAALQTERTGYAAVAQRISGHINILGNFYLMLLGYKFGRTGINIKEFTLYFFLCSTINMSIGGRVWIVSSSMPFFVTYILSRKTGGYNKARIQKDNKLLAVFIIFIISLFSLLGLLRGNNSGLSFWDKFMYLTDGTRMTNMVLSFFPEDSFLYEYGKSTLLSWFFESPMVNAFKESISDNIGLLVTVKSIMPCLYYDFGVVGGSIFWGVICFFIEVCCIRLISTTNIFGLLLFGILSIMLFQSPVGNVIVLFAPNLEWLLLLYIFRKPIFKHTT